MQLTPHYGPDPLVTMDGDPAAIAAPAIRQRQRLADVLATFTDEQWSHPSRCDGWSARDVVVHLDGTNFFWTQSVAGGCRGEPTRFLETFDPVATPARSVAQSADLEPQEVLARFRASTDTLVDLLESLDECEWAAVAEAPPGHLATSVVVHHALWDAWIHERDILLPLSIEPVAEPDEVIACLRYVATLAPALSLTRGEERRGRLSVDATEPDAGFVVDISDRVHVGSGGPPGDATLSGPAVDLVEELSIRQPFDRALPREHAWMITGLAETFDHPV